MALSSSSYKAMNPIGLGPHLYDLFRLNYLLKALSPNIVTLGVRASAYEFRRRGGHKSIHSRYFSYGMIRRLIRDNLGKSSFSYT